MSEPIRAVDRALDILLCFNKQSPQLSMSQIAEQVGMNKSTVHRLLGTLEKRRFVQRNPATGQYQLGIRLLQMAYLTLGQHDLRQVAAPYMRQLCEQYRETMTLSVLDDADVVFLDVVESPQRVKLAASTGQRLPAFATAAGKAILAYLPKEHAQKILEHGLHSYTAHTILSIQTMMDEFVLVRQQGFSISMEEYEEGINAVSAPIFGKGNVPIGAISAAGPAYRLTYEQLCQIGMTLMETGKDIALEVSR